MTQEIRYICDTCHRKIEETDGGKLYGPLCAGAHSPHAGLSASGDFCSLECMQKWVDSLPMKFS